jgi:ribosomal protein L11 methylase PrmA
MSFEFGFFTENHDEESRNSWYDQLLSSLRSTKTTSKLVIPSTVSAEDCFETVQVTDDVSLYSRYLAFDVHNDYAETDLIPGVYEGGFKMWECTTDVIRYLSSNSLLLDRLKGSRVLDLGCGNGFLGIFSLLRGASCATFSDFNDDVLTELTCKNILRNCSSIPSFSREMARCFSGDWLASHKILLEKYVNAFSFSISEFDFLVSIQW